jgi:uncharacterized protein (TIGR03067 family)
MRMGICFCFLCLACGGCSPDVKSDDDRLTGTWDAISLDSGTGPEEAKGIQLTISKVNISLRRPNGEVQVWGDIIRIDRSKFPNEIDIRDARGTWLGIFDINGDQLKLVARDPGEPRPTEFSGSMKGLLFTLIRAK